MGAARIMIVRWLWPRYPSARATAPAPAGVAAATGAQPARDVAERLPWLDLTRLLCAVMILAIHWLRAAYNVGLFGRNERVNLVMNYQSQTGGLRLFDHLLIAGTGRSLWTWLTNLVGILGGFGWEAVSALIIVSGFSLALAQRGKTIARADWAAWYGKRARRILIPFYTIALPFVAICALAIAILPHVHGAFADVLDVKLVSQFRTPPLGVLLSHLVLFDPYARQGTADFVAPAWWFVPAILLAYAAYPLLRAAATIGNGLPLLAGAALVTIASYAAADAGVLLNETWYYIVLQELFNFSLGIVLARWWLGPGRAAIERGLGNPFAFAFACVVFVVGNIANWTADGRPIASMLYGPSLLVMIVFISKRLQHRPFFTRLASVDAYDLYLVHQPFAFPIALASKIVFHDGAIFIGWFVFLGVAVAATTLLTAIQRPLNGFLVHRPVLGGGVLR